MTIKLHYYNTIILLLIGTNIILITTKIVKVIYWCFCHTNNVEHRSLAAKKPMRRMLIKEYSLDSYTWQRKYAHLTSSITRAAVDEKLRRFSVSASMEEISKQANNNENMGSQVRTHKNAKTHVTLVFRYYPVSTHIFCCY